MKREKGVKKKKRKDENEFLDEPRCCVRHRLLRNVRWGWSHRTMAYTRRGAIDYFCQLLWRNWDEKEWVSNRKKGLVACVKVRLVEQP